MKERAIQTLGYFPVGDEDFPHQKLLLQGLMDSVEVRHYPCISLYTAVCISISTLFISLEPSLQGKLSFCNSVAGFLKTALK